MKATTEDRNFDGIAEKFEKNIYGSTKGRLRHELLLANLLQQTTLKSANLTILDAGGGTGVMTEALLNMGHRVTLADVSKDALDIARQRMQSNLEQAQLQLELGDILSLDSTRQYDLVICHAVLEWVSDWQGVTTKLLSLVKPNGLLSLSFFNRDAQLFGNMCYGNFDYVEQGMQVKNRVRLTPNKPLKPSEVLAFLDTLDVNVTFSAGIRCFHDYMRDLDKQEKQYEHLKKLELEYGSQQPYKWLGKYFQVLVQKL
jgi:S-adenosylmethionine-dependent methyltransferase